MSRILTLAAKNRRERAAAAGVHGDVLRFNPTSAAPFGTGRAML
jgi:hypothetical protein